MAMTREEFLAGLSQAPATNSQSAVNLTQTASIEAPRSTFAAKHQRPGVPLDVTTGAPWETRLNLAFSANDESRVTKLQNAFQGARIEPLEDGNFIVRGVAGADGKETDLLVDERTTSAKDFIDLAAFVPEVVGAALAVRSGKPYTSRLAPGFKRIFAEAAVGASGSQTVGALMDAADLLGTLQPEKIGEALESREKLMIGETLLGGGLGAVPGLFSSATKRIARVEGPVQTEGLAAVEKLADKTGIRVRLTIGEETGNPNLLTAEGIASKSPTGREALKSAQRASDEDMLAIQRTLMGEPVDTAKLGNEVVENFRKELKAQAEGINTGRQALMSKLANDVGDLMRKETGLGRSVYKPEAGEAIRGALKQHYDAFKTKREELYAEVGADPLINTASISKELQAVKEGMPKGTRVIGENELVTGFDEFGPISVATDVEGREVIREFVPEGLSRFLTGISKLDKEMPLSELRALRTQINDAKRQAEILPGTPTRLLSRFSNAVTQAIEEAAPKLDDPGVVERLKKANQFYREGISRFEPKGIVEILGDPSQVKLGNYELVNQALRQPDQFFRIKEALLTPLKTPDGVEASPAMIGQWNLFRKAALTEIEDRARLAGSGELIDANAFLREISSLEPQVVNELLGPKAATTLNTVRKLGVLQGRVNADDLTAQLGKADPDIQAINRLGEREEALDKAYRANVIKKFVKGEADATSIEPGEFVDRFIDVARDESEVAAVMSRIGDPEKLRSIRSRTVQNIFRKSAHSPAPEDIARNLNYDPTVMVDPKKMSKLLTEDEGKYRTVLGNDRYNLLRDYLRVETMRSVKDKTASTVGGLVGGSLMSSIMTLDLKRLPAHVKYGVAGVLLSHPQLLKILQSTADPTTVARAAIVSAPFIEGVMEEYGKGPGTTIMRWLGEAVGLTGEEPEAKAEGAGMSREDFIKGLTP